MRVALFATGGEIPIHALRTLVRTATVVAIIRTGQPSGPIQHARALARRILSGPRPDDELSQLAKEFGIPEWRAQVQDERALACRLVAEGIDVACLATFPRPLSADVIYAPRLGTVNLHASLLPRHRGPNPWFWTYHADDRDAGVTAHVCEPRVDRGPILAQSRWPLPRGYPVAELHRDVAERGAALLPGVLAALELGDAAPVPQNDDAATRAPRGRPGVPMLDPRWPAERTWHFLAGLVGQYREPLRCDGQQVRYLRVPSHEIMAPQREPGSVVAGPGRAEWRLWCTDGFVRLEGER